MLCTSFVKEMSVYFEFYKTFLRDYEIILKNLSFFSITGKLEVDEKGDRKHAIAAIGNILANGSINFFGLSTSILQNEEVERHKKTVFEFCT